jgi:hypothetical protein
MAQREQAGSQPDDGDPAVPADESDQGPEQSEMGEPQILVVVGAHLRAEVGDRPLAYRVRQRVVGWLQDHFRVEPPEGLPEEAPGPEELSSAGLPCGVVVCSDVLYLNDAGLRVWPTISIGGPGVNALAAFLGDKLPSVFVIDDVMMVQMDPELKEVVASVWGIDHKSTVGAVDVFLDRYLDQFMEAATRGWGE